MPDSTPYEDHLDELCDAVWQRLPLSAIDPLPLDDRLAVGLLMFNGLVRLELDAELTLRPATWEEQHAYQVAMKRACGVDVDGSTENVLKPHLDIEAGLQDVPRRLDD